MRVQSETIPDGRGERRMHDHHVAMHCHDHEEHHVTVQAQDGEPGEKFAAHHAKDPAMGLIDGPGDQHEGEEEVRRCEMEKEPVGGALQTLLLQDPQQENVSRETDADDDDVANSADHRFMRQIKLEWDQTLIVCVVIIMAKV